MADCETPSRQRRYPVGVDPIDLRDQLRGRTPAPVRPPSMLPLAATAEAAPTAASACASLRSPTFHRRLNALMGRRVGAWANIGATTLGVDGGFRNLSPSQIRLLTGEMTGRWHQYQEASDAIESNVELANSLATFLRESASTRGRRPAGSPLSNVVEYCGNSVLPQLASANAAAFTLG